ncbi:hypothetical protein JXA47_09570 [Candidatus Sumerlaeota bacterium]|nr:hypothetical protein [Candidatus Sumerlaeota bacterium]
MVLCTALAGVLGAGPAEECAWAFLDAIVFQDAATAWSMLDDDSRAGQTPEGLTAALAALPIIAERAEIVGADPENGQWRVRFRLHGVHRTSGEPMTWPGTLRVVGADPAALRIAYQPPAPSVDPMIGSVGQAARQMLPGLPPSQVIDGVTAQDVLDRAVTAHGQIRSMRMGVSIRGTAMGQAISLDGDFLYSAPDRMRLDLGQVLFFSDRGGATIHMVPANAYFRLPGSLSGGLSGLTPGLGGFAADTQASLVGRESVAGFPCWHLVLASPGQGMTTLMGQMGLMHVWLDEQTYLPHQARAGAMGISVEIRFHSPTINPEGIDPGVFTFRPPPGAMEIPMMLPGLPGMGGG